MSSRLPLTPHALALSLVAAALSCSAAPAGGGASVGARAASGAESLAARRNLAAALYEEDESARAVPLLREIAEGEGAGWRDQVNLGSALRAADSLDAAEAAFRKALAAHPDAAPAEYGLGLVLKARNDNAAAAESFRRVVALEPRSPEALYQLGVVLQRQNDTDGAADAFTRVVDLGFDGGGLHYVSGLYRQSQLLFRKGDREAGQAGVERYKSFVDRGLGKGISDKDLEKGMLTDPLFAAAAAVPAGKPPVFRSADAPWGALAGLSAAGAKGVAPWAAAADVDGDGREDLLFADGARVAVLAAKADGGYEDRTAALGLAAAGAGAWGAVAADLDEDGRRDLLFTGIASGLAFYWADSAGAFARMDPEGAKVPFRARVTPWDYDHDGDLDLLCWGAGALVLRNQGERRFEAVTDAPAFAALENGSFAVPFDADLDRDSDLLWGNANGGALLARSLREGRFASGEALSATGGAKTRGAAVRDFDADGDDDAIVIAKEGTFFLENLGIGDARSTLPFRPHQWTEAPGGAAEASVLSEDWNLDGAFDLLLVTGFSTSNGGLFLGVSRGGFAMDAAPEALPAAEGPVRSAITLDADGDGDLDLVTAGPSGFAYAENAGAPRNAWIRVELAGTKNNTDGIGSVVEVRAGTLYGRRVAEGPFVTFGLGEHPAVQTVRVTWPNGILQNVTEPSSGALLAVTEKEGLVGSCPFLYAWNGRRFGFVSDVLGITPLGLPMMPGRYVPPDCDEFVLVRGDELAPRDGKYVFQFTEELREVTYLDHARLQVVDHPAGSLVFPNERFTFPPFPEEKLYVVDDARPPVRVTDPSGADVTDLVSRLDGRSPSGFALTRYQGITEPTYLEIDLGPAGSAPHVTMFLTGWLYWTNASINVGLSHDPTHDFIPPYLEVADGKGGWTRVPGFVGFPAGKTKTMPVDLTGLLNEDDPRVRLATSLRLYWDRILISTREAPAPSRVTRLDLASADLHFRGWSAEVQDPDPTHPERFDYARVSAEAPWPMHEGFYTRYGDVAPLLSSVDDRFVIVGSGDEATLTFDASGVPPVPEGWTRDYLLYLNGWAKDGDPNTVTPTTVDPLPFHAMSGYPYRPDESYPADAAHQEYRKTWNTRREASRVTPLAAKEGAL